jgi:hypothetical protein
MGHPRDDHNNFRTLSKVASSASISWFDFLNRPSERSCKTKIKRKDVIVIAVGVNRPNGRCVNCDHVQNDREAVLLTCPTLWIESNRSPHSGEPLDSWRGTFPSGNVYGARGGAPQGNRNAWKHGHTIPKSLSTCAEKLRI